MALRDLPGLRRKRGTSRRILAVAVLCAAVAGVCVDAAIAQAPAVPLNDNYLSSLQLNQPGTVLNSTNTLLDNRDTTSASVQTNIFNPCGKASCPAGPAEVTAFGTVSYGKTIWYDYYPNKNGLMQIRTAGFDNVICVYQFSMKTFLPDVASRQCIHQSDAPAEQLVALAKARDAYTVQIGGVDGVGGVPASGPLQLQFDFIPAKTPRLGAGSTLKAQAISGGLRILTLNVSASKAKHITVRCSRGCKSETKKGGGSVNFPGLQGVSLAAGSKLEIFATKPGTIGAYIQYNITVGNFSKINRCLEPGSMKPRNKCQ